MKKNIVKIGSVLASLLVYHTISAMLQGELVTLKSNLNQLESSLKKSLNESLLQKSKITKFEIPYATNFPLDSFENIEYIENYIKIPFKKINISESTHSPVFLYIDFASTERTVEQLKGSIARLDKNQKNVPFKYIIFLKRENYPSISEEDRIALKLQEKNTHLFILDFGSIGRKKFILDSQKNKKILDELNTELKNIIS